MTEPVNPAYCDRCGEPVDIGTHAACRRGRALEPPRFCPACRRRMKVQVLPRGWVARCVEHGELASVECPPRPLGCRHDGG